MIAGQAHHDANYPLPPAASLVVKRYGHQIMFEN